jgi:ankyrin repeat protein
MGSFESAKLLIESGADLNRAMNTGSTPLFIASQKNHFAVAKLLVEAGANINLAFQGRTPLQIAKSKGYTELTQFLESLSK